jgi:hypothetical protein
MTGAMMNRPKPAMPGQDVPALPTDAPEAPKI